MQRMLAEGDPFGLQGVLTEEVSPQRATGWPS